MAMRLEQEQEELLVLLVEAARNVPREEREPFTAIGSATRRQHILMHRGLRGTDAGAYLGDIEILARAGLLHLRPSHSSAVQFDITPHGYDLYASLKQRVDEPVQIVEDGIRSYFDAAAFRTAYPEAYKKWLEAESMLWKSDSLDHLTTIGHLCREALQEFADALVTSRGIAPLSADKAKTVARIRAALDQAQAQAIGSTTKDFLAALLAYWGTISDLVQRQEHGSAREGQPLVWEDGRRVVFQTAIVMFEIARVLSQA
ncbi:MAG TPA: hypothetical protein VGO40_23000 [Longimicrobium sp.]|jgi:hypothetical protein|nr:hypothetical protein [Longimicrobium sp.]